MDSEWLTVKKDALRCQGGVGEGRRGRTLLRLEKDGMGSAMWKGEGEQRMREGPCSLVESEARSSADSNRKWDVAGGWCCRSCKRWDRPLTPEDV